MRSTGQQKNKAANGDVQRRTKQGKVQPRESRKKRMKAPCLSGNLPARGAGRIKMLKGASKF